MKKLLPFIFLLLGCATTNSPPPVAQTVNCKPITVARGTNGSVNYSCTQLSCAKEEIPFRCEFQNMTSQIQPSVAIRIVAYYNEGGQTAFSGNTIYSDPIRAYETNVKYSLFEEEWSTQVCGLNLKECTFLVEKVSY